MPTEELKLCPLCSGESRVSLVTRDHMCRCRIYCKDCHIALEGELFDASLLRTNEQLAGYKNIVINRWNTRN